MYSPKLSYLIKLQTFYLVAILSIYIIIFSKKLGGQFRKSVTAGRFSTLVLLPVWNKPPCS